MDRDLSVSKGGETHLECIWGVSIWGNRLYTTVLSY
jgi:hypothetical protein